MKVLRILKAIGGTAMTWGVAWSLLSVPTLWHLFEGALPIMSTSQLLLAWVTNSWLYAFTQGAVIGAGFGSLLNLGSRWLPALRQLSFSRLGLLGAVAAGGAGFVVLGSSMGVVSGLVLAGLGASTAVVSLLLARRAPERALAVPSPMRDIMNSRGDW